MDVIRIPVQLVDANTGEDFRRNANQYSQQGVQERGKAQDATEVKNSEKSRLEILKDIKNLNTQALEGEQKKQAELMKFLSQGAMQIANGLKGILTKSFEVVEMIYKKLSAASPLLQAIEQLFNLAWTIFFMPIGNKLGELLIPAVIQLVDKAVAFWDEIGDGGLGDIVTKAVEYGIKMMSSFLKDIGKTLSEQGGIVGRIGNFLQKLGNFIEKNGEKLLNIVFDLTTWVMENIGLIISLIGMFMTLHYTLQIATMAVIAASSTLPTGVAAGLAITAGVVGGVGMVASEVLGNQFAMAEGGYVPATEGGSIHLLGEGGEGEYVIPESKVGQLGGNHYSITLQCYDTETMKQFVKDVVSDEISKARLRSGY